MMSMLWTSQVAFKLADFATILYCSVFIGVMVWSYKASVEGGVNAVCQFMLATVICLSSAHKFWNQTTLPQDDMKVVNSQNQDQRTKVKFVNKNPGEAELGRRIEREEKPKTKNPPPVIVESTKKKQRKGKKPPKKNNCNKENKEPVVTKKELKMHPKLDICEKLNRDTKSIYDYLHQYILTDTELRMNHFPHEGYHPYTQVDANESKRACARCGESFQIVQGALLSDSKCHFHPRKATFLPGSRVKVHGCCNGPYGSAPCAVSQNHVTIQHSPRPLTKTASRRHVRRDLQHRVLSLDCEMVYTTDGLEVVRVGLVNLDGAAVYDGYCKPKSKILDYNTIYSGINRSHLQNVTMALEDVKTILMGLIQEDTILVGHALNNDLAGLGLIHGTVVDTSVLYADPTNPGKKTALKKLASEYLGLTIQDGESGHDCIDDARASLQLALLKVPPADLEPVPEEPQPSVQEQVAAVDFTWRQQQLPLAEIQNFHHQYQASSYDYCGGFSQYFPHSNMWSYQQPIHSYTPLNRRY